MSALRDFAISLTNPAVLTLWLLVLAGALVLLGRWRAGVGAVAVACAWTFLWSIPTASDALRAVLEQQHPPRNESALPRADAIVVLGGGGGYRWLAREDIDPYELRSSRVAAGARAWLAGRAPLVILSGGGAGHDTEARAMAGAIERLGVPRSVLVLEERSTSTAGNARYTAELAADLGAQKILLVTSSLHMPRANLEFANTSLEVIAVPVPERAARSGLIERWRPSRSAVRRSGRAFKELAALTIARVQHASRRSA